VCASAILFAAAIPLNVLVCYPARSSHARGDLFYYLQLVSAAASAYTRRCSATCAAGQREEYQPTRRDLTTRAYFVVNCLENNCNCVQSLLQARGSGTNREINEDEAFEKKHKRTKSKHLNASEIFFVDAHGKLVQCPFGIDNLV